MDENKINQLLMLYSSKMPDSSYTIIKDHLSKCNDESTVRFAFAQMKDPTIALVLSIIVGHLGIDRIYLEDYVLGILKLITCGGCFVWWIIDLFLIMNKTKEKNLETLLVSIK